MFKSFSILFTLFSFHLQAEEWKLLYKTKKIKVFHDTHTNPKSYKAEGFMKGSLLEIMAVISDTKKRTQWVQNMKSFEVIEGNIENTAILYEYYNFPWPASDRDTITKSIAKLNYQKKEIFVEFANTVHPSKPPKKNVIRIPHSKGTMYFRYENQKETFIKNTIQLDIGGDLPQWLVEMVAEEIPVKTIESLEQQVMASKGQYTEFINRHQKKLDNANLKK